jgi:carboxymethylenebutenolidase
MAAQDVELGYLAYPKGGTHPGVVMIHDVWGLTDHTRDLARRLAQEEFAVLALDLYRRARPEKIENPGQWMRDLSDPQVLADVRAGVEFLGAHPASVGRGAGVIGFCMGGMYSLLAACGVEGLSAAVSFYGLLSFQHGILHDPAGLDPAKKPREPLAALADLVCPLLCFYGDRDEFVSMQDIERLKAGLADASHPAEVVMCPGCGHAFMNDTRAEAFRPEAAETAWKRMVAFLRMHLA